MAGESRAAPALTDLELNGPKAQIFNVPVNDRHGLVIKGVDGEGADEAVRVAFDHLIGIVILVVIQGALEDDRPFDFLLIHDLQVFLGQEVVVAPAVGNQFDNLTIVPDSVPVTQGTEPPLALGTGHLPNKMNVSFNLTHFPSFHQYGEAAKQP